MELLTPFQQYRILTSPQQRMHIFEQYEIKGQPRIEELNCNDEMMYRGYVRYVLWSPQFYWCELAMLGSNVTVCSGELLNA